MALKSEEVIKCNKSMKMLIVELFGFRNTGWPIWLRLSEYCIISINVKKMIEMLDIKCKREGIKLLSGCGLGFGRFRFT